MRKRITLLAALAMASGLALAPLVATADPGHCTDTFILSGHDPQNDRETRAGTNPGAVSCTVNDPDVHPDTNYTVPGSTALWVGIADTFPNPTGTITIGDDDPIALDFELNSLRGRFESQSVDLTEVAPGTVMTATVDYDGGSTSVTYTRI